MSEPFSFCTKFNQVELLGRSARNLVELLEGIKEVSGSCIYYHTHRFLLQHHYLLPGPPNDFAYWVTSILQESILGEKFFGVDIVQFRTIRDLRMKFVELIENYLDVKKQVRDCPEGYEFQFMSCRTFILPTPYVANNLDEFRSIISEISIDSLYFHCFEARLRLERDENDFSRWLKDRGEVELAREISKLDPYSYTLEGLRKKIISLLDNKNG
jgi:hypothetical protein